jgi:hypothetical protein
VQLYKPFPLLNSSTVRVSTPTNRGVYGDPGTNVAGGFECEAGYDLVIR